MATVLMGVARFFEIWTDLSVRLVEERDPPWDFEKKAVIGKTKDILAGDTALVFVTWAKRAQRSKGIFRRAKFVRDELDAELKTHKVTAISKEARRRLTNKLNNSANQSAKTFVHYGLFKSTGVKNEYALTEKGTEYYDTLEKADIRIDVRDSGKRAA